MGSLLSLLKAHTENQNEADRDSSRDYDWSTPERSLFKETEDNQGRDQASKSSERSVKSYHSESIKSIKEMQPAEANIQKKITRGPARKAAK